MLSVVWYVENPRYYVEVVREGLPPPRGTQSEEGVIAGGGRGGGKREGGEAVLYIKMKSNVVQLCVWEDRVFYDDVRISTFFSERFDAHPQPTRYHVQWIKHPRSRGGKMTVGRELCVSIPKERHSSSAEDTTTPLSLAAASTSFRAVEEVVGR